MKRRILGGFARLSAVFAGAHIMRVFLREAKPVANGRKRGIRGVLRGARNHKLFQIEARR